MPTRRARKEAPPPRRRRAWPRLTPTRALAGTLVLLGLLIVAWPRGERTAPAAPPTAVAAVLPDVPPTARPDSAGALPLTVSFVAGQRAIQVPVGLIHSSTTDLGELTELQAAPPDGGLLISLPAPTTEPLRVASAGAGEVVVVYVRTDRRVAALQPPARAAGGAAVAPYTLALVARRATPHLGEIVVGDRMVLSEELRGLLGSGEAPPAPVPVPPRGSPEPYPAPRDKLPPAPRPTERPAYPGP